MARRITTIVATDATKAIAMRRKATARDGVPLLARTATLRAALLLGTAVAATFGDAPLAAHQIATSLVTFLAFAMDAIAIAGQALIGRYLGADDPTTAREAGRRMLQIGLAAGAVSAIVVLAVRPVLPEVFSDDPEVVALAGFLLLWVAALQPLNALAFVLDGLLIGAGDMRFLAIAMIGALGCTVPVAAAVLWLGLGIGWVWATVGVLMLARAVALSSRWRSGAWAVTGAAR